MFWFDSVFVLILVCVLLYFVSALVFAFVFVVIVVVDDDVVVVVVVVVFVVDFLIVLRGFPRALSDLRRSFFRSFSLFLSNFRSSCLHLHSARKLSALSRQNFQRHLAAEKI